MSDIRYNVKSWFLPKQILGKYVPKEGSATATKHKVYVPVVMPQISYGEPKSNTVNLSSACFCNSKDCKIKAKTSIKTQNYLTVPVFSNNWFGGTKFKHGCRFYIEAIDGNVDNMHITNKIDESTR